jgi:O-antigen ligase
MDKAFFKNIKIVEILFYSFPFTFIIGNFFLNLNLLIFVIASLFLIRNNKLNLRFKKLYWIIVAFFLYLLLLTAVQFESVYYSFISSLEGYGYHEDQLKQLPLKDHPVFKSFLLLRYLILFLVVDILFFNKILNLKKFCFASLICTSFVSIDVIIQSFLGTDLFGFKSLVGRNSGPFGDEVIAGGYLLKFGFLSIFLVFDFFKNKNFSKPLPILVILIHAIAICVAGNRMSFMVFLLGCLLIILLVKNLRFIFLTSLIIFLPIFFGMLKYDESVKYQYFRFFQEITHISATAGSNLFADKADPKNWNDENKNKSLDRINFKENGIIKSILTEGGGKLYSGHGAIWRTSIQMWKENPMFGFGLKSFRYKCRDIISSAGNSNIITAIETTGHMHDFDCSNHPHNYYLELLSETGLIGTILLIIFFVFILKNSFSFLRKFNNKLNPEYLFLIPIMLAIFLEIWPIKSTGSFFSTWNATWFWIFASILLSSKKEESN